MSIETVQYLIPEIILVVVAFAIYLGGTWIANRSCWPFFAAAGLLISAGLFVLNLPDPTRHGPLLIDAMSNLGRGLALSTGLLFVMLSARSATGSQSPEFFGSLLLAVAGFMLISAAGDLVLLFLGLELISIPTYLLLYLCRQRESYEPVGEEAAAKYFFLSVFASALLLYGLSFLYGAAGSTTLTDIYQHLIDGSGSEGSVLFSRLALIFILAGIGFKITAVPFHFYAPDVYQGTSHPAAGFLAVIPKAAGFFFLARLVVNGMPDVQLDGWRLGLVLAVATMTLGNVLALWQNNIRRLLAYSSIAHTGYMLIGITVALAAGYQSGSGSTGGEFHPLAGVFVYVTVYALATIGIFAALTYLGKEGHRVDQVDELAGLGRTHPAVAIPMAAFLFSLAGTPPLAGFWGKLTIFYSAIGISGGEAVINQQLQQGCLALAVIGVLNAVVAAAYYLRIVGVMYFRPSLTAPPAQGGAGALGAMAICAVLVVGIGCFPGEFQIISLAQRAAVGSKYGANLAVTETTGSQLAEQHQGDADADDFSVLFPPPAQQRPAEAAAVSIAAPHRSTPAGDEEHALASGQPLSAAR